MKNYLLASVAVFALIGTGAWAAEDAAKDKPAPAAEEHHDWTLKEAREHAHAKADKLDKMTEKEWAEQEKKYHERVEKWKAMSPEEKEAAKKRHAEWKAEHKAEKKPEAQ